MKALLLLFVVACGSSRDVDDGDVTDGNWWPVTGDLSHYVSNHIILPSTPALALWHGLDLDGDGQIDNALAPVLGALRRHGIDLQPAIDDGIARGQLLILHTVRSDDSTLTSDDEVIWKIFIGEPSAAPPRFDGTDAFTIKAGQDTTNNDLNGPIRLGTFSGGPGNIYLQVWLPGVDPITLALTRARLSARVTATTCSDGVLGGVVTGDDLQNNIIPALAPILSGLDDARVRELFDGDGNGQITAAEIQNSEIGALLQPDVDLNGDGTPDGLSLGIGFTCVNASFTTPDE